MKNPLILFLAVICLIGYVSADLVGKYLHKDSGEEQNIAPAMTAIPEEESVGKDGPHTPKPKCKGALCPRVYKPICAAVNNIPLTAPSMCHYNEKIRCYRYLLEPGEPMPVFRVLHQGACTEQENNYFNRPQAPKRRVGMNG